MAANVDKWQSSPGVIVVDVDVTLNLQDFLLLFRDSTVEATRVLVLPSADHAKLFPPFDFVVDFELATDFQAVVCRMGDDEDDRLYFVCNAPPPEDLAPPFSEPPVLMAAEACA
jgi:hypothetical protein